MDFQNLFLIAHGRIGRQLWWIAVIVLAVASAATFTLMGGIIVFLVGLTMVIPGLTVSIKRCHDRGKSGWWCLLFLVPIVGFLWGLIDLGILKGEEGPNQYGPDPLDAA
ncbi:MAG: DUF805 domain-containing protein [Sphingomonadales bacterium]